MVSVRDTAPDHRSRNSWTALPVLFFESLVCGIPGSRHVFGNLIVIAPDDGGYLAYAHLQQGSARVRPGDRVGPETLIGRCGNSGSSSSRTCTCRPWTVPVPRLPSASRSLSAAAASRWRCRPGVESLNPDPFQPGQS